MKPTTLAATALALVVTLALPASARAGSAGSVSGWTWPIRGDVVTPYRNGDDPYAAGQHRGIDIAAPVGSPVLAAAAGTVTFAGTAGSSGLTVAVRTADGRFDTSYLHLSEVAVREGEELRAGERLGAVGTSGRRSVDEPHLHFGVREAGFRHAYRDPMDFLPTPAPAGDPREPAPAPAPAGSPGEPEAAPGAAPVSAPDPAHAPAGAAPAPGPAGAPAGGPARAPAFPGPAAVFPLEPAGRSAAGAVRGGVPALALASPAAAPSSARSGGAVPVDGPASASASAPAAPAGDRASTAGALDLGSSPTGSLAAGSARAGSPAGTADRPAAPSGSPRSARPASGGLDAGWLAACLGLLALAAALGRSATRPPRATAAGTRASGGTSRRTSPALSRLT